MKLPTINSKFKEPDLKDEPSPFQNREARNQKQYNWNSLRKWGGGFASIFDDILGEFTGTLTEMIDHFNDMVANPANKDVDMSEVRIARKPQGEDAYPTLGDRLNAGDDASQELSNKSMDLAQNTLRINTQSDINSMRIVARIKRDDTTPKVMQGASFDTKTGDIYITEQTDDAATQHINRYDANGVFIETRDLKLTEIAWLEGNSLFRDPNTDEVKFIIPIDIVGNWVIFNYETGEKSGAFKLEGVPKYCIDNTGQYFVTMQNRYFSGDLNGTVQGFNVYDLDSVIVGSPALIKFIPTKDSIVRGGNKIQGIQMIDDLIYIGRGKTDQWFRTTVIDSNGIMIGDYNWDKADLQALMGYSDSFAIESEGVICRIENDVVKPVLLSLVSHQQDVFYSFFELYAQDGTTIDYSAGASVASLTRPDDLAKTVGISIIAGGAESDESVLTRIASIKEIGTYSFTATEGNLGLSPNMKSTTGIAVVRQIINGTAGKIVVFGSDYDNTFWSIYYDNGNWTRWAKSEAHVPLWKGSTTLDNPITLDRPITPYSLIGVLYKTNGGQVNTSYGYASGISINAINSDNSGTAVAIYETVVTFPTATTASLLVGSVINISGVSGATINRINNSAVSILEIWGVV